MVGRRGARRRSHPLARRGSVPVSPQRSLVVALSGGIGGAKLVLGLSRSMPPADLLVIVNTSDDFEHLGLAISPDLDTVTYTLAGLDDPRRGWGRRNETWTFMSALAPLGGETWFQLGDGDLAIHVERTRRLRAGESLSVITADFCRRLGIATRVVPMTDDQVRTRLETDRGLLEFQDYFVRQGCAPVLLKVTYAGAPTARAHSDALAALHDPRLRAVVICPSNPLLSIEPVLAVPGISDAIAGCAAPVIAVSPIIGGRAVKGPTAKMMAELGVPVTAAAVARRYAHLLDGYVLDHADAGDAGGLDIPVAAAKTLMLTGEDREGLARAVLAHADALAQGIA
jgi:LPPG:FO 2-phospho-L-lactate transferase